MTDGVWDILLLAAQANMTLPVPISVRHESMSFGSARVQLMKIKRATILRVLTLAKVENVKDS
jgi:hypothetical protein